MKKLLLVILLLTFHTLQSFAPDYRKEEKEQRLILAIEKQHNPVPTKIATVLWPNDTLSNVVLESIKKFEGLRLTSYLCPANQKTIGYGHCIKATDQIGDTITLTEAENILKKDFTECINFVKSCVKGTSIENQYNKILALAHFVFNVGSGNFERSSILARIKTNEFTSDELLKWIHYRDKDNNLIASEYLKQIRQYEVDLFNQVS